MSIIGCPHCTTTPMRGGDGRIPRPPPRTPSGSCCICHGTRRASAHSDHLLWLWEYIGCDCAACSSAAAFRVSFDASPAPERPTFTPDYVGAPADPAIAALIDASAAAMVLLAETPRPARTKPDMALIIPAGWRWEQCVDCGEWMVTALTCTTSDGSRVLTRCLECGSQFRTCATREAGKRKGRR